MEFNWSNRLLILHPQLWRNARVAGITWERASAPYLPSCLNGYPAPQLQQLLVSFQRRGKALGRTPAQTRRPRNPDLVSPLHRRQSPAARFRDASFGEGIADYRGKELDVEKHRQCDPQHIRLENPGVEVTNPLQQARTYAEAIASLLKKDPTLVAPANAPHAGKLLFPYGYGVVFTNIVRAGFERVGLYRAIETGHVIAKDEMYESADPRIFQERLWQFRNYSFGERLSDEQVNRIRGILYPEIRIERQLALAFEPTASPSSSEAEPDRLMRVMDLQQEQLARSLGEGHRVIHGVAGSGKTLILLLRAEYLAQSRMALK